jgi:Caspase domain
VSGARTALIIANAQYDHEGLRHLVAPAADAEALARVLGDSEIGGFDVRVVRDEPAHVVEGEIEELFSEARPDDVLLVHFSCHGLKSESGELYFAASNTRPNRLGSTAIAADFVQRCMRSSRSRSIVLLLDCCYGGAFSQGVRVRASGDLNVLDSFPTGRLGGGRGRAVITASSAMEYAFEGDQLADDHSPRPSMFTSALVEGLATGDADRDEDGWVSLNEMYDYVFDHVREQNPNQTPSRDVEMQGELYLARRSRPVARPAPLPVELQQAVDHPLAGVRAGAVNELVGLLGGRHAGLALAAKMSLEQLAGDDSRTVAAAAAAALEGVDSERPPSPLGGADAGREAPAGAPAQPPAAPPRIVPEPSDATPSPHALPTVERRWWHDRRLILGGGIAAVAVVAAVIALNLGSGGEPPENNASPSIRGLTDGSFTAEPPWRFVVRNNDVGAGCNVTLTHTDTGQQWEVPDVYTARVFQMREAGSFTWESNDPGCLVFPQTGAGQVALPFAQADVGDSDAFDVTGKVAVEIVDYQGNGSCDIVLHDAGDGRQLDFGEVPEGGPALLLDPRGSSEVYVSNVYCKIRVASA